MVVGPARAARRELADALSTERGSQSRGREDRLRLAAVGLIPLTALAAFATVRLTGGSPNPLNHLGYLPILIAAYTYGWRGALAVGLTVSVLLGPLAAWLGLPGGTELPDAWARVERFTPLTLILKRPGTSKSVLRKSSCTT